LSCGRTSHFFIVGDDLLKTRLITSLAVLAISAGCAGGGSLTNSALPGTAASLTATAGTISSMSKGTGISAVPAQTLSFSQGCTAQFVKAASGLINETNRTDTVAGSGACPRKDVQIQFRPVPPNPGTANPACPVSSETGPLRESFQWYATTAPGDKTLLVIFTTGAYNACFYPAVLATPAPGPTVVAGPTALSYDSGNCVANFTRYSNGVIVETDRNTLPTCSAATYSVQFRPLGTALDATCPATSSLWAVYNAAGDPNLVPMFGTANYNACFYPAGTSVSVL
jgi:hypothetical protein